MYLKLNVGFILWTENEEGVFLLNKIIAWKNLGKIDKGYFLSEICTRYGTMEVILIFCLLDCIAYGILYETIGK